MRLGLRIFLSFFFLPCFLHFAEAQWQSVGNVTGFRAEGAKVTIRAGESQLLVHALAPDLFRIRLAPKGTFEPDRSVAVVKTDWPVIQPKVTDAGSNLKIATDEITIVVQKRPLRLQFVDAEGRAINADDPAKGMSWDGEEVRIWKTTPLDENYYGFGEKAGRLNKKHKHMAMWNSDIPAYKADTDPLYQSIPFFYGIRGGRAYAIFFDNTYWSSFDMGKESMDRYSFGASGGELNYYFFYGPSPKKILSRFTELVGRMPLPPRWSLGYQQCRWSYAPESRVREIAKNFREKNIPADVMYLDIDYMEGYRIFTWDNAKFPDPTKMISDLRKDGFRIAVIVDPGIKQDTGYHAYRTGLAGNHFLKYPDGRVYSGKVWPGECAFPDFSSAASRRWWGDQFKMLIDAGVRGWWNDMNEPSVFDVPTKTVDLSVIHDDEGFKTSHRKNHNTYGMQMTQATYDGVKRLLPSERPFVLTRASYAGGHRYSAAWTGDNIASWEHLQMAVPMCLNLSISGQPFVGTDIGGFIGYPSGELFARWLQLGVFTPLMRAHSVINEKNKEPWEYGEQFTEINRKTIELRYRLLPYIYNALYQASVTGIPPMRPLVFEYPDDGHYQWNETEFMFGDDLLVAPVLWEGATKRTVRLPKGIWYDYWTQTRFDGGKDATVEAPIDRIPIFVRAGAVIPTQQLVQYTDEAPIDPLTYTVYPGGNGATMYYEDDGISFDFERGSYFRRTIHFSMDGRSRKLALGKVEGSYDPPARSVVFLFIDTDRPRDGVLLGRRKLSEANESSLVGAKEGWSYSSDRRIVLVKFPESRNERTITIQ
ncbi:MAG TPA: glycoside hydrolase family 31 protein [Bacteroidota bacterium]|nr:glycoside hydrolase family 31 protein [Bacteroidota bacterium]